METITTNHNEVAAPLSSSAAATANDTHPLSDKWTLWAHLPHDTDWSLKSYKKIYTMSTVEETIAISESLPEKMVKNCMMFIMRENITPMWEDVQNRNGGCFSYKVLNKNVHEVWKLLTYALVGNTVTNKANINSTITGITISPKKNFCIIKIWMSTCSFQNPEMVREIEGLPCQGCLFKKHSPEY